MLGYIKRPHSKFCPFFNPFLVHLGGPIRIHEQNLGYAESLVLLQNDDFGSKLRGSYFFKILFSSNLGL